MSSITAFIRSYFSSPPLSPYIRFSIFCAAPCFFPRALPSSCARSKSMCTISYLWANRFACFSMRSLSVATKTRLVP